VETTIMVNNITCNRMEKDICTI